MGVEVGNARPLGSARPTRPLRSANPTRPDRASYGSRARQGFQALACLLRRAEELSHRNSPGHRIVSG